MEMQFLMFQPEMNNNVKRIRKRKLSKNRKIRFKDMRNWYKIQTGGEANDSIHEAVKDLHQKPTFLPRKYVPFQTYGRHDEVPETIENFQIDIPFFFSNLKTTESDPKFVNLISKTESQINEKVTEEINIIKDDVVKKLLEFKKASDEANSKHWRVPISSHRAPVKQLHKYNSMEDLHLSQNKEILKLPPATQKTGVITRDRTGASLAKNLSIMNLKRKKIGQKQSMYESPRNNHKIPSTSKNVKEFIIKSNQIDCIKMPNIESKISFNVRDNCY